MISSPTSSEEEKYAVPSKAKFSIDSLMETKLSSTSMSKSPPCVPELMNNTRPIRPDAEFPALAALNAGIFPGGLRGQQQQFAAAAAMAMAMGMPHAIMPTAMRWTPNPLLQQFIAGRAMAEMVASHTNRVQNSDLNPPLPVAAAGPSSSCSTSNSTSVASSSKVTPIKKYKCDVCGKAFSRSNTLITHKRIHTGEKPFKCEHCGRAFRQPGNLTRHRLTHTTVKPYICSQCGKAFNRASNLHTHMRTHSSYRPFLCPYCAKGFHQRIDMKVHIYTHTGERSNR